MNKKISIIVPIYNMEKYLEECIISIINQTYKNLEIILVNDGSKDNSLEICNKYAKKDKRIKVIDKENGGISDARNVGIKNATGTLIGFVDSDDYIAEDMYEILYNIKEKEDANISGCNRFLAYDNGQIISKEKEKIYKVMNNREALINLNSFSTFDMAVWDKLYDIDLWRDIEFPVGKLNEDYYVMYKVIDKVNKMVYTSTPKYYYRQRENSISRNKNINMELLNASYSQIDFFEKNYSDIVYVAYAYQLFNCISLYNDFIKYGLELPKDIKKKFKTIAHKNIKYVLKSKYISLFKKVQAIIFTNSFNLYKLIVKKIK